MERKQFTCNSFVFYGSFYEAISVLPLENQARIYDAIFKFAFEDIEVDLEGADLAVFLLVKPQLIANRAKYENGCKGGRPRKNENQIETEIKPNENQTITETKPNDNDNVNVNVNDISLLNILKEKINNAGLYTGVHDGLINEVLEVLNKNVLYGRSMRFNGKMYGKQDYLKIANRLQPEHICRCVNALLSRGSSIGNREYYIMSLLCSEVV